MYLAEVFTFDRGNMIPVAIAEGSARSAWYTARHIARQRLYRGEPSAMIIVNRISYRPGAMVAYGKPLEFVSSECMSRSRSGSLLPAAA